MPPLRWGLLGTAHINRRIVPALRASGRSVVAAVGSRDQARADAFAAAWGIPHAFGSYEALLDGPVDVVYVALPNSLHVRWTLAAVARGRHVLCEKPLSLTPADIDRVEALAAQAGMVVAEGFMYLHHAQTIAIEAAVASGLIGELRTVVGEFSYLRSRTPDVRLDPALGGGVLFDVGCYPVSLAQRLAGASPVAASAVAEVGATGVDEQVVGAVRYHSGVCAHVYASFRRPWRASLHVLGTAGHLHADNAFRPDGTGGFTIARPGRSPEHVVVTGRALFEDQIADMEAAVLDGRPPGVPLADSRRFAVTLAGLAEAWRSRAPVALDAPADTAPADTAPASVQAPARD